LTVFQGKGDREKEINHTPADENGLERGNGSERSHKKKNNNDDDEDSDGKYRNSSESERPDQPWQTLASASSVEMSGHVGGRRGRPRRKS
jgi:hypothetical protein